MRIWLGLALLWVSGCGCASDPTRRHTETPTPPDVTSLAPGPAAPHKSQAPYSVAENGPSGTLEIVVSFPTASDALRIPRATNNCGQPARPWVDTHVRHKIRHVLGVPNALVRLVGVDSGKPLENQEARVAIAACQLSARAIALTGDSPTLIVESHEETPLTASVGDSKGVRFAAVGQAHTFVLSEPGVHQIRHDRDALDIGHVLVAAHPYAGATDRTGSVRFEQVPAGKHKVEVWHRPVSPDGPPLVGHATVEVTKDQTTTRELLLSLPEQSP